MKSICVLGFLLMGIIAQTFAQTAAVFKLSRLPQNDTVLSGWKFHTGDDPRRANIDFDDSKWPSADLGQDVTGFRPLHTSGIVWARLHIAMDSAIAKKQLAAFFIQYTAADVYLSGKLYHRFGVVSADKSKVIACLPSGPPFQIDLKPGIDNVLAVRMAYQPGIPYISIYYEALPVFSVRINDRQTALANYHANQHKFIIFIIIFSITGGILAIIGFIHFVNFLFDRSQRINLYYSLFTLTLCINALPVEIWGVERFGKVSNQMWVYFSESTALTIGMLFMLMTIYELFGYPQRAILKVLTGAGAALVILMLEKGTLGNFLIQVVFPVICLLEAFYVCIWAIKRRKQDAGFILGGVFLFILVTVLYSVVDPESVLAQILFYVAQIFFPIGMSFYLGVQGALTNKKLKLALSELQLLSAQNLAQEQEKQQLLANQNELLERQVGERTAELSRSLIDLRSTQDQLIQKEKMASLGELTAGIAHEIQNPLNFIKNFSEVNAELIEEIRYEINKGDLAEISILATDIEENSKKINQHGKRADAIVKGMLQHFQGTGGNKQPTNINAVADEYLQLCYHGLRAKDPAFHAAVITNFDAEMPKINVVPQNIGQIMLNLFNNSFYAIQQKLKTAGPGYEPMVEVKTFYHPLQGIGGFSVRDNGAGIPDAIKDKIMQPFFTTKPTGEGTGLGLSLTYDMVVKAHAGTIQVNSTAGEGAEFVIELPA